MWRLRKCALAAFVVLAMLVFLAAFWALGHGLVTEAERSGLRRRQERSLRVREVAALERIAAAREKEVPVDGD